MTALYEAQIVVLNRAGQVIRTRLETRTLRMLKVAADVDLENIADALTVEVRATDSHFNAAARNTVLYTARLPWVEGAP